MIRIRHIAVFFVLVVLPALVRADKVRLKNGMVLEGRSLPLQSITKASRRQAGAIATHPIRMIDTGYKRYFVPLRQVEEEVVEVQLDKFDTFKLKQPNQGRSKMLARVGLFSHVDEWDKYGRRRVTIATSRGPLHVIQGITEIGPKYVKVEGLSHIWEFGLATSSIEPKILDAMIREVTDDENPNDRISIARFYMQAEMYPQAGVELDRMLKDFPDYRARVEKLLKGLSELQAQRILRELNARRRAGQHALAYTALRKFPRKDLSTAILREVDEILEQYNSAKRRADEALVRLGELEAGLDDSLRDHVVAWRSEIRQELDYETVGRLDAFVKLSNDEKLSHSEKLALAYSGWILGSANAVTDLAATERLWRARFLIGEYLRSDDSQVRTAHLAELENLESLSVDRAHQIVELLPPAVETPHLEPGKAMPVKVKEDADAPDATYTVLLPTGYNPHHKYPMIVALRGAGRTTEDELTWWGGTQERPLQSQRRGYIVIAPEYADRQQREHDYSAHSHQIVEAAIRDARKRFSVDSDRVFLAGHGMGGDAVFDIAMSHPQLFAGAIPITGISDRYCRYYWQQSQHVAWYVVGGELDRDTLEANAHELNAMMKRGHQFDVVAVEYVGRGFEHYYEEIHNLFDWMDQHKRTQYPKEMEVKVLRPVDNHFYWIEMEGFPRNVYQAVVNPRKTNAASPGIRAPRPMLMTGRVTPGNTVYVRSGAERTTVYLAPGLVDFEKPIEISINSRTQFRGVPRAEIRVLLEDLRIRGDRQKPFVFKKSFD